MSMTRYAHHAGNSKAVSRYALLHPRGYGTPANMTREKGSRMPLSHISSLMHDHLHSTKTATIHPYHTLATMPLSL